MANRNPAQTVLGVSPANRAGPAPLAQWQSSGLLIHWFRVRAPGGAHDLPGYSWSPKGILRPQPTAGRQPGDQRSLASGQFRLSFLALPNHRPSALHAWLFAE